MINREIRIRFIRRFYTDVLKLSFMFFACSCIILFVIERTRFNPMAYLFSYIVCFGVSFILCFRKPEKIDEFTKGDK